MESVRIRPGWTQSVKHGVVGSMAVGLLTFFCFRVHLDFASAIPLYMLLVVLQSLTGDFLSAALVGALSAGSLDFFFTQPLFSLRVTNPLNGLALVAFIITAAVITGLVSRVREQARSARLQKDRLDRLYQLSQQLLALEPDAPVGEMFLAPFHRLFGVTAVCVFDADTGESYNTGDSQHQLAERTRDAFIHGHDVDDASSQVTIRCLRVGGKITGTIGFEGLQDAQGTVASLTALTTALLDRTKAFRRASAAAAAAQTEVYRSAVLDALAHEFKTPLATILAAAGGLREVGPLAPEQHEMADTVENEAARLGSLTSRLLRTARLDREEVKPRMELINVSSLVSHIAEQYSGRSQDRRIIVRVDPNHPVETLADPELLRLTVSQLIENACKYSQPGSTVTAETEKKGDFVMVRVSNSGSSIPYNERHHIFERFYRGTAAQHSTPGSGLGLYVARKIALAHGGALDLELEKVPGEMVAFCLKIPATKVEPNYVAATK
jgi:two-component system sensor histidine kinase KdpD